MGILAGSKHGDAANELMAFCQKESQSLEESGHYFMSAISLAMAVESAVLAYLLVEFGEDNGGELEIPDSINMAALIEAANEIEVLDAPTDQPSGEGAPGSKYVAKDVIDKLRQFRNLIHPARALRESFDPEKFTKEQLEEYKEIYDSVLQSLLHYI